VTAKFNFPEYGNDYQFSKFETLVLDFWKSHKIFQKVLDQSSQGKTYFFYDGPPFATGTPHYGHILAGTIKDVVPRYFTMNGYSVARRFGWDTHGLPVEFEMEKTLGLKGSLDIQKYGVGKFNEACRSIVLRYAGDWRTTVERMGRWIDMDNDYKTMDPSFMESVWWVFKELWSKGLIYEGKKVVPYSWRLTAALSNFEATQNYKDVQDPAVTVLMPFRQSAKYPSWVGNTALAVWTTTPWTLPSNLAIAVNRDPAKIKYGRYALDKAHGSVTHVIVAQDLAENFGLTKKVDECSGSDLEGVFYEPLFSTYVDATRSAEKAFRVIHSDHVTSTDGTGLVHMAPAFGEDDFFACQREKISLVDPTDVEASFTSEVAKDTRLKDIVGLNVKDADKGIIKVLKDSGRLFKQDTLQHAYPFCYRSDTPLIYKAISAWYVKIDTIKDAMIAHNQKIHWVPAHIRDGRFGKWLENAHDWCISRNRFWGTPIPVWTCAKCAHRVVVGSRKELDELLGNHVDDLHMHIIDKTDPNCPKCKAPQALKRTPEVLDCWFESGSMPYAQEHYPFENKAKFEASFPADFIGEGLDQTRGWFYTLTVLATALFDQPAFKNCIVNGMVLAEDGKKMSKRLKNYPDPNEIFAKHGADALRLYLIQSPTMRAEELRFSEKSLVELMRAVMLPLWNAYSFFASYANIDGWTFDQVQNAPKPSERSEIDQWILARAHESEQLIHRHMRAYDLASVAPVLINFIDDLTNWYIRLSRDRFWADAASDGRSKNAAYATLWTSLDHLSLMLAPFLPFYAEVLSQALRGVSVHKLGEVRQSVHARLFERFEKPLSESAQNLLARVDLSKRIILLGRALRGEAKIGLRQPLSQLKVAGLSNAQREQLKAMSSLICKEVNVKSVELVDKASDLVEESAKPNHRVLGKKVGKDMKAVQEALGQWSSSDIAQFESKQTAQVLGYQLNLDDVQIVRKAKEGKLAQAGFGVVAELDIALNDELIKEGVLRELINRVQQMRKEAKLHLADRIQLTYAKPSHGVVAQILREAALKSGLPGLSLKDECLIKELVEGTLETGTKVDLDDYGHVHFSILPVVKT
jgi:isoleucyl-tRNA synthetase